MSNTVSVIMNTFNGNQRWLLDAAKSYLDQKTIEAQLIVSTVKGDPSLETLSGLSNVEFCINDTPGIYSQLNNALDLVDGSWFCYAAGDDVAFNNKFIKEISSCKKAGKKICSSGYVITDQNLKEITRRGSDREYDIKTHLNQNFISDCSMVSSDLLKDYGPFDIDCGNHAFWDFWLRVAKDDSGLFLIQKSPTWYYRQHSSAKHSVRSRDREKVLKNERERKIMIRKHTDLLKKYNLERLLTIDKYKYKG